MAPSSDDQTNLNDSVSAKQAPVTHARPVATDAGAHIQQPGVSRANYTVSQTKSGLRSKYHEENKDYTVLQQHVLFWDRDGDGQITPWDTYVGFRELGFNMLFSLLAMLIINLNFSYPSRLAHSWFPDPWFRVYVHGIHKAKHGSDSGVIDNEGRFVPQAFENLFAKYDRKGDGTLTLGEIINLMHGQRVAVDPFGWGAALFEWGTTWLLLQKDGRIYKDDLRQVYDGSIFWNIRKKRQESGRWNKGFGLGGDGMIGSVYVS
ncbi:Caleosin-domain-containing protein [Aspergillus japonicus CBS 114.51]|nr:Caleosin-domain-containing protein [Aspergillus japonicus CBS 114.51]RAH77341.1 Caleosin-domain-containing protein [Aspergillus japonicus CBS 114.51]